MLNEVTKTWSQETSAVWQARLLQMRDYMFSTLSQMLSAAKTNSASIISVNLWATNELISMWLSSIRDWLDHESDENIQCLDGEFPHEPNKRFMAAWEYSQKER